jgi:intracellular sulfur oxidation DsrE/DsrF family protein
MGFGNFQHGRVIFHIDRDTQEMFNILLVCCREHTTNTTTERSQVEHVKMAMGIN